MASIGNVGDLVYPAGIRINLLGFETRRLTPLESHNEPELQIPIN